MANPVWNVLQFLTAWPMVRANQNAAPPARPFSTYQVRSAVPLTAIEGEPDATGKRALYAPLLLRCELNFYGPDAEGEARRVALRLRTDASQQRMAEWNLALARIVAVNDLSGIVDDPQASERANLEFTMNATDATDEIVGLIEGVTIAPDEGATPPQQGTASGPMVWSTCTAQPPT